ncbi:beta-ureidopropionase [Klebsiella pneumoniae]|uniref:Beta-ureidopropionase n=1 Tax=Klebsiella pneumoniae TaxID=573 RepID=A0A377TRN8_KLEPN|nr:beta-ureidopropionase [Klebsiella pneumoniae]
MSHYLQINGQRLIDSLYALGEHGALPGGGVCRLAATAEDKAGRDFVVARMKALGLSVSIDAIGNVTGVYHGEETLPMVMMGHISIPSPPVGYTMATTALWPALR